MATLEILHILPNCIALYVTLASGLFLYRYYKENMYSEVKQALKILLCAFAFSFFNWIAIIIFFTLPSLFVIINPLLFFTFTTVNICFYHFVFLMTKVDVKEKFPFIHYILPVLLFFTMLIWSLFIPHSVQLSLTKSRDIQVDGYEIYSAFFTSKLALYYTYTIVYVIFGLYRTVSYRKILVNFSADEYRSSFSWLYQFFFSMIGILPMVIIMFIGIKKTDILSLISMLPICLIIFRDVIIAHNILLDNYVIIASDSTKSAIESEENMYSESIRRNDIKKLEAYIQEHKPYLNPRLKITDLTVVLNTNRTSLSRLINRAYGMNFCRYVNRLRMEEFEQIKSDPQNSNLNTLDIVCQAGFSDYRGYLRVKKREKIYQ